jgi:hypothetical protein
MRPHASGAEWEVAGRAAHLDGHLRARAHAARCCHGGRQLGAVDLRDAACRGGAGQGAMRPEQVSLQRGRRLAAGARAAAPWPRRLRPLLLLLARAPRPRLGPPLLQPPGDAPPEATGSRSNSSKSWSMRHWNAASTAATLCSGLCEGAALCSRSSCEQRSCGKRSGRVEAHWPHLMKAGPARGRRGGRAGG